MRWCCTVSGTCVVMFVDFRWASGDQSIFLGCPEQQNGAVVGVSWPLSSGPISGPLSIYVFDAHLAATYRQ